MSPLTSVINAIHHGQLNARQRELLIALLLNLATGSAGMTSIQDAYRGLLAAGGADQHPGQDNARAAGRLMTPQGRAPLTLDQLIAQLIQLRALYPQQGPRPVHLLNMDCNGDGLVTDVDLDSFHYEQEPMTSLLSAPCPDAWTGAGQI